MCYMEIFRIGMPSRPGSNIVWCEDWRLLFEEEDNKQKKKMIQSILSLCGTERLQFLQTAIISFYTVQWRLHLQSLITFFSSVRWQYYYVRVNEVVRVFSVCVCEWAISARPISDGATWRAKIPVKVSFRSDNVQCLPKALFVCTELLDWRRFPNYTVYSERRFFFFCISSTFYNNVIDVYHV